MHAAVAIRGWLRFWKRPGRNSCRAGGFKRSGARSAASVTPSPRGLQWRGPMSSSMAGARPRSIRPLPPSGRPRGRRTDARQQRHGEFGAAGADDVGSGRGFRERSRNRRIGIPDRRFASSGMTERQSAAFRRHFLLGGCMSRGRVRHARYRGAGWGRLMRPPQEFNPSVCCIQQL